MWVRETRYASLPHAYICRMDYFVSRPLTPVWGGILQTPNPRRGIRHGSQLNVIVKSLLRHICELLFNITKFLGWIYP